MNAIFFRLTTIRLPLMIPLLRMPAQSAQVAAFLPIARYASLGMELSNSLAIYSRELSGFAGLNVSLEDSRLVTIGVSPIVTMPVLRNINRGSWIFIDNLYARLSLHTSFTGSNPGDFSPGDIFNADATAHSAYDVETRVGISLFANTIKQNMYTRQFSITGEYWITPPSTWVNDRLVKDDRKFHLSINYGL